MPFFKVTLAPDETTSRRGNRLRNPFDPIHIRMPWNEPVTVTFYRVWERMEAKSAAAIREYFRKAKEADLEHVRGHHIKSIKRLRPRRAAA